VKVVENATGYQCAISPTTKDSNVVQIPKIYIALQCMFNIFITAFIQIMNLLTRPMYLLCKNVYSANEVCLRFISCNLHSWAQQVSNLRYSVPIVNESFLQS